MKTIKLEQDPMDMQYEELMREVFNCNRRGDLFGLADADIYRHGIRKDLKHRLVFGISAALKKFSKDCLEKSENSEFSHKIDDLDFKLWSDQSEQNINLIISQALELINKKDY